MSFTQNLGINLTAAASTAFRAVAHPIDTMSYGLNQSIVKPAKSFHTGMKALTDKSQADYDARNLSNEVYIKGNGTNSEASMRMLRGEAFKRGIIR